MSAIADEQGAGDLHMPMAMDTAIGLTALPVHTPIMAVPTAIMVVHTPITAGHMAITGVPESASALPSKVSKRLKIEDGRLRSSPQCAVLRGLADIAHVLTMDEARRIASNIVQSCRTT